VRITWDEERAQNAQLLGKDMWRKYPRQMFRSRAVSEGIRTVCPMATSGMYVPEEVQDIVTDANPAKFQKAQPPTPQIKEAELVQIENVPASQKKDDEADTKGDLISAIFDLSEKDGITESDVLAFLAIKKANKGNVEYVADLPKKTLKRIVEAWDKIVSFKVAASMEEAKAA
jgi:hypothetical protein